MDDCRLSEHVELGEVVVLGLDSVFHNRCQIAEQSLKTVHLETVGGLFGIGFEFWRGNICRGKTK